MKAQMKGSKTKGRPRTQAENDCKKGGSADNYLRLNVVPGCVEPSAVEAAELR